jgi:hypothetical protein
MRALTLDSTYRGADTPRTEQVGWNVATGKVALRDLLGRGERP